MVITFEIELAEFVVFLLDVQYAIDAMKNCWFFNTIVVCYTLLTRKKCWTYQKVYEIKQNSAYNSNHKKEKKIVKGEDSIISTIRKTQ